MTVVIYPRPGEQLTTVVGRLRALAHPGAMKSSHGGIQVDDALALAYLTRLGDTPIAAPKLATLPPALAAYARNTEGQGGLTRAVTEKRQQPAKAPRKRSRA